MDSLDWQKLVQAKLSDRQARIPREWHLGQSITSQVHDKSDASAFDLLSQTNILTPREHDITEKYDAATLIKMMATGVVSSLEVTTAFCKRATLAQQLVRLSCRAISEQ